MIAEFLIYLNQNMNNKQQIILLILTICICALLIKIDKYIERKKNS